MGTAGMLGTNGTAAPGTTDPPAAAVPGITVLDITPTPPARLAPCFRFDGGTMSGGSVVGTGFRSNAR